MVGTQHFSVKINLLRAAFGYIDCIFSPRCVAAQQANYVAASCTPSRRRRLGCRPFTFLREASTQLGA
jgi:hypothetical protein